MDLYGPMRVESINGKRYILVIVDDYSRYTWVHFLRSKDEAPEALCYPKNDREDIGKLGAKGLDLTYAPSTITSQKPTERELDLLFEAMYDDYIGGQPSAATRTTPAAQAPQDVDEPPQQQHVQQQDNQAPLQPKIVADNVPNAMFDGDVFENPFAPPSTSAAESSSSQYVDPSNMHTFYQPYPHEYQ
ncbi:retrovirus-related pol polyprotein from transposon TNT 1-94 [Tanacetum coccineum]